MILKIQEIGTVQQTKKGKDYTNVLAGNAWYSIIGNLSRLLPGTEIECDPKPFGKSIWAQEYRILEIKGSSPTPAAIPPQNGKPEAPLEGYGKVPDKIPWLVGFRQSRINH